ncbi:MAG: DUF6788 family protein [bacterium]
MPKTLKVLERAKKELFRKVSSTNEIIKGSLVIMSRVCGHPNCKCVRGEKHVSLYLSQFANGKPRMLYIPKAIEKQIKNAVGNYKEMIKCINELSEINIEIIKKQI